MSSSASRSFLPVIRTLPMLLVMALLFAMVIVSVDLILTGSRCMARPPLFEVETRQLIERMLVNDMIDRERAVAVLKQNGVAGDVGMKPGTAIGAGTIQATLMKSHIGMEYAELGEKLVTRGIMLGATTFMLASVVLAGWVSTRKRLRAEAKRQSMLDGPVHPG